VSGAWPIDRIREELGRMQAADLPTHGGRTLAYVYDSGLAEADAIGREALAMFAGSNGLDPTAFPSLLRMENELVGWAGRILDAPTGFAGSATSGGTESILLTVLAARDARPDVVAPAMVVPSTAHAAFHKAAHYFGVRLVAVPVDEHTFRADAAAMSAAIDDSTVLVVVSAPSYAHGVVDPVAPVATAAAERGVRCHVDACIGGWVLPWLDRPRDWTFAVPGVTSVSVDLHKYAYTPKGVSLLLHRDAALRSTQLFASADWPGYTMLNSTTQSTRSGGPLAAAWAVVHAIGDDGYARLAKVAREATLELERSVSLLDGLRVLAHPDSTLLAVTADDAGIDVFSIADEMLARGWFVQPQMAFGPGPANLHLTVSAATAASVPDFVAALEDSVAAVRARGPVQVPDDLAAAATAIDPATLDDAAFDGLLQVAGLAGEDGGLALPDEMAQVNALLAVAPPALREALLLAVLDRLLRPLPEPH
jgi:glutamate/tyrosine decarboxylase-like PLP-dependent enzyme